MSLTFANYILLLFLIILLIILLLFFLGRIVKKRLFINLGLVTGVVGILLILLSFLVHYKIKNDLTDTFSGKYHVNLKKSKIGIYNEIRGIDSLIIIIDENNNFHLNIDAPFLSGKSGKWNYFFDGEIGYGILDFNCGTKNQFGSNGDILIIEYPKPKYGNEQVELLYFDKLPLP